MNKDTNHHRWIVCQIGARELYAIPRALHRAGRLDRLLTDIWLKPGSILGRMVALHSTFERWHPELPKAQILAPTRRSLFFEFKQWILRKKGINLAMARNREFQKNCLELLRRWEHTQDDNPRALFAFSYAARDLFRYAKSRGWSTVLGQIDPGPAEENLVAAEHERYPRAGSKWTRAGEAYWKLWREETELADRIIVNSEWARDGLLKSGVAIDKIEIIPLVCDQRSHHKSKKKDKDPAQGSQVGYSGHLEVLFLGNVCLRKGIGRLVDAMRLLTDEMVELTICGHLNVSQKMWSDLPNVRWIPPIPNSSIGKIYQAADVFILPTISDGFARTQMEAMAVGTPVIASLNCGHLVLDGINGFQLQENSPEEIAALLKRICRDRTILQKLNTKEPAEAMLTTMDDLDALLACPEIKNDFPPAQAAALPAPGKLNSKREKRRLFTIAKIILFMAISVFCYLFLWADWPNPRLAALPDHADMVLVLGGEDDQRPRTAKRIYDQGRADIIAVSGDGGQIITALKTLGLPDGVVWHEDEAKSTFENARFCAPLIQEANARKVILVTCWFHANRARSVFEDRFPGVQFFVAFEPRKSPLNKWDRAHQMRERFAMVMYLFRYGVWCW